MGQRRGRHRPPRGILGVEYHQPRCMGVGQILHRQQPAVVLLDRSRPRREHRLAKTVSGLGCRIGAFGADGKIVQTKLAGATFHLLIAVAVAWVTWLKRDFIVEMEFTR